MRGLYDEVIHQQPIEAQKALLEVIHWLIHADGVLDEREVAFLEEVARSMSLSDQLARLSDDPTWSDAWVERLQPVAHYVLMQGAMLAVADGECHIRERERLEQLEHALDAEPGVVDEMLEWATTWNRWMAQGMAFLAHDSHEG